MINTKNQISVLLCAVLLSACGQGAIDSSGFSYELEASDQTLSAVKEITIKSARVDQPMLVVIFASGLIGAKQVNFNKPLGFANLPPGTSTNIVITVDRALHNGEPLHAFLYHDSNNNQQFDNGLDVALRDEYTRTTNAYFRVSIDDKTAHVHLKLIADEQHAYRWTIVSSTDPTVTVGSEQFPTLDLKNGLRYWVDNAARAEHPLELAGGGSVLLAEGDNNATFTSDTAVNANNNNALIFNLTDAMSLSLENYRCRLHPDMQGQIKIH